MKTIGKNRKLISIAAPAALSDSQSDAGSLAERIATAAYYRAEARGFAPGQEMDDWLAAEQEIGAVAGSI